MAIIHFSISLMHTQTYLTTILYIKCNCTLGKQIHLYKMDTYHYNTTYISTIRQNHGVCKCKEPSVSIVFQWMVKGERRRGGVRLANHWPCLPLLPMQYFGLTLLPSQCSKLVPTLVFKNFGSDTKMLLSIWNWLGQAILS